MRRRNEQRFGNRTSGGGNRRGRAIACLVGCLVAILASAPRVEVQTVTLTLDEVLRRVSQSVLAFENQFGNRVADETYEQRVVTADGEVNQSRRYTSQLLFHRPPAADTWSVYRRLTTVDGEPTEHTWLDPREKAPTLDEFFERAARADELSNREFLGRTSWRLSTPLLALVYVHPLNRYRSRFEKIGEEVVEGQRTWVVRFTEHRTPAFIRNGRRDLYASGSFWAVPDDGRIVRSDLVLGASVTDRQARTRVTVTYRPVGDEGIWLPTEMQEQHDNPLTPEAPHAEGSATLSNYRPFVLEREAQAVAVP